MTDEIMTNNAITQERKQLASSVLMVGTSRVLTVEEANAIRQHIKSPRLLAIFDVLLYTGIRFSELQQVTPDTFDKQRGTIRIRSTKALATQKYRNVILTPTGVQAVERFLADPYYPKNSMVWQHDLMRWAQRARLGTITNDFNPTGITARTTRKTWESWLMAAYPEKFVQICMSQGHSTMMSMNHYLNTAFTREERNGILVMTAGWIRD